MASFLHCYPYSYHSSNYRDSCCSFSILKMIAKSKEKNIVIAFKCEKERQLFQVGRAIIRKKERSKEIIPKRKQRRLRTKTLQGAKEKSPIFQN